MLTFKPFHLSLHQGSENTEILIRGASQDFIKKYPKNTDILAILGIKSSNKIVQKRLQFYFFSLKESFSLVL